MYKKKPRLELVSDVFRCCTEVLRSPRSHEGREPDAVQMSSLGNISSSSFFLSLPPKMHFGPMGRHTWASRRNPLAIRGWWEGERGGADRCWGGRRGRASPMICPLLDCPAPEPRKDLAITPLIFFLVRFRSNSVTVPSCARALMRRKIRLGRGWGGIGAAAAQNKTEMPEGT